jgi:hypothetical protein
VTSGKAKNCSGVLTHGHPANFFTTIGSSLADVGGYAMAAFAGQKAPLKPGVYFLTVRNTGFSPMTLRVAAKLFDSADKDMLYNLAFLGGDVRISTVSVVRCSSFNASHV